MLDRLKEIVKSRLRPFIVSVISDETNRLTERLHDYYSADQLFYDVANFVVYNQIPGDYLEFGVYRGDSFSQVYQRLYSQWLSFELHELQGDRHDPDFWQKKRFFAFDSFAGLPKTASMDTPTHFQAGVYQASMDSFLKNIISKNVDLSKVVAIPGWFDETLNEEIRVRWKLTEACVIFIDCDLYESAVSVFGFITDLIREGTVIIIDDYFRYGGDPRKGVQGAFREWRARCSRLQVSELARCNANRVAFVCHSTSDALLSGNQGGEEVERKHIAQVRVPFVSVILPTFNRSHMLEEALRTVCEQDYPKDSYEVIVVDNNSSDDTELRVRSFGQRAGVDFKYIKETRPGLVFARHSGAAHARGEILLFGDDDALYDPNWISAIVDVYVRHPAVGAVGTKIEIKWDEEPAPWVRSYEGYLGKISYGPDAIVKQGLFINGGSFSIRKDVLYAVRGFGAGQKGEYILGDSETGLCRKLAAVGIPVGCTSAATVWHVQLRERNGTFRDLKRRFRNNGICQAYADTFYGRSLARVVNDTFRHAVAIIRDITVRLLRSETENLGIYMLLQMNEFYYRIKYLVSYRFHPGIRREISRRDWELSPEYRAPEPEFYFQMKT